MAQADACAKKGMQDYGMRIYERRLGRFLSVDPISNKYPELTPYQFASNTPVEGTDLDGLELNSTSTYVQKVVPVIKPVTSNPGSQNNPFREKEILMPDIFGNGHIGPESVVKSNVAAIRQNYYNSVGANIAGGPFGAAGYMIDGDKGSFVGASFDGVALSFGGFPGKSSALSKPANVGESNASARYEIAPYHYPVDIIINKKSAWTIEQKAEAYEKAQSLTNDPDTKVTIKNNPSIRLSNLRSKYIKDGGVVTKSQDVDHIRELQLNGTNAQNNLKGRDRSVNRSFGPQIYEQIKNLPDNTKVNRVVISIFPKN